jgi:hypothetical protein
VVIGFSIHRDHPFADKRLFDLSFEMIITCLAGNDMNGLIAFGQAGKNIERGDLDIKTFGLITEGFYIQIYR